MPLAHETVGTKQEEEWQELQALLQSGILDKAPNLRHFLEYVAEQHFAGKTEQIKEYNIAVQALHRHEQFDPQSDTIVRVTAHTLRKKLEQYYAMEGADHRIQIRLPTGKYVLQFERKEQIFGPGPADLRAVSPAPEGQGRKEPGTSIAERFVWPALAIAGGAVLLWLGINSRRHGQTGMPSEHESVAAVAKAGDGRMDADAVEATHAPAMRIRFGATSNIYTDVAGQTWHPDRYCTGGTTFSRSNREIQGTDDPALFQEGREGKFQCRIPAPPGAYQLQVLFADTAGDKVAARQIDFSVNNVPTAALDIVDEAGGDDVAVGKVYAGIHPMSDGTIHLDFTSDGSFVNAAEITPSASDKVLPIRMLAGPEMLRDDQGSTWLPERFFQGGRRVSHTDGLPKVSNSKLFAWERYGHFRYSIPVVAGKEYKVRLYFSEGWFGKSNGGPGGIGSRLFDVYCNGTTLLRNFDILKEQKDGVAVATFHRVKPTAHDMLELDFSPIKNYPLINAIEVEPED
jgi:hypothetical protein